MNRPLLTMLSVFALAQVAAADTLDLDFNTDALDGSILAGQQIDDEFAALGLTITGTNNNANRPDAVIAFDTANPTGNDPDLATPGTGPGNTEPLGMALIIAENLNGISDGYVDAPDDERAGGTITFLFDQPLTASGSVTLIDIEERGGSIQLWHSGSFADGVAIPAMGDNSVQTLAFELTSFDELRVNLASSGAVGSVKLAGPSIVPEPATMALFGMGVVLIASRFGRRGGAQAG